MANRYFRIFLTFLLFSCTAVQEKKENDTMIENCRNDGQFHEEFTRELDRVREHFDEPNFFISNRLMDLSKKRVKYLLEKNITVPKTRDEYPLRWLEENGFHSSVVGENITMVNGNGKSSLSQQIIRIWLSRGDEKRNLEDGRYRYAGFHIQYGNNGCFVHLFVAG